MTVAAAPDDTPLDADPSAIDFARFVKSGDEGVSSLTLVVDGIHCGACVARIERALGRVAGVVSARVNLTTRRLHLAWRGDPSRAAELAAVVTRLGFRPAPYDPGRVDAAAERRERDLLRALAVAGFAAGNVMLLSVSVWAGDASGMGVATRELLHWVSALIALPAIVYAGRPFFHSALAALKGGHANMDLPISLAVTLAAGMSLYQTIGGGGDTYFDSAITLLFFLLIGRYLDSRARGKARAAAEHLLALGARAVTVLDGDGVAVTIAPEAVIPGMTALVTVGERIAVDGRVVDGVSDVDGGLITGESVPVAVGPGEQVFAGTLNLTAPLRLEVTAAGEDTLLAEIVALMEAAEQGRARYVDLASRIARLYVPVVHALATVTFLGWLLFMDASWQGALITAIAVLIVTCPCALALAVPVVQVIAGGRLFRAGILLKSATALERLAAVDTVVFDKTGTLTEGVPALLPTDTLDDDALALAASLAAASRHPLARALIRAAPPVAAAERVREEPGQGLELATGRGPIRLGNRRWCGVSDQGDDGGDGPELLLARPGHDPVRFVFRDRPRADAALVVAALKARGLRVGLLSGDRAGVVAAVAAAVGIESWHAEHGPAEKCARLAELAATGRRVVMIDDGLNDAPALAAAAASMSPAAAADISQTAADVVFQGRRLAPVVETLDTARRADRLVKQNFGLALVYNAITVPLAIAGLVTPLIAAVAMSASSLAVTGNALRLGRRRRRSNERVVHQ